MLEDHSRNTLIKTKVNMGEGAQGNVAAPEFKKE